MLSIHKFATLLVSLTLTFSYAFGDVFKYKYESDGGYVSGMFRGKWYGGNVITDISNVSVLPNGIPLQDLYEPSGSGYYSFQSIKISAANPYELGYLGFPAVEFAGAQISFDGTANNFLFYIDSTFYFTSRTGQIGGPEGTLINIFDDVDNYTGPFLLNFKPGLPNSSWSVTLFKVPDNGTTIAMLAMGFAGLAFIRRRLR